MRYIFLVLLLTSCTIKQPIPNEQPKSMSVFDGSISKVLGCIFAPQECKQLKEKQTEEKPHQTQEEYQQEITKELDELDKEGK